MPPTRTDPPSVQLILVRHAETVANVEGRWIGSGGTELTDRGRSQVEATARRLADEVQQPVALYTSPLPRAWETAHGIGQALGRRPTPVEGLREVNFGDLEGITLEELETRDPALYRQWQDKADEDFRWPGGDRRGDFFQRIARTCDQLLSRHAQGTLIVVGHSGTIRACLAHLLPEEMGEWWTYPLDNCGLTRVVVGAEAPRLLALNDTAHLEGWD